MAIRLMCADNVERLWRFQSGHPGARGQSSRVPIPAHDVHLDMVHRRLAWSSLPTDGVDDLIHTGHPRHAGKDDVHAGVMLLHRAGGAAVPHHHTIVILVSSIPQAAFDHTGGGVSSEEQRGHPKAAQEDSKIRGVKWAGGVFGEDHVLTGWCQ